MNVNDERAARGQRPVPSAEAAAKKWRRNSLDAADRQEEAMNAYNEQQRRHRDEALLGPIVQELRNIRDHLARIAGNLDHVHDDVAALREVLNIPRPECYAAAPAPRRARTRKKPAAPIVPPPTSPQEPRPQTEA